MKENLDLVLEEMDQRLDAVEATVKRLEQNHEERLEDVEEIFAELQETEKAN